MANYFVITNSDGDVYIEPVDKERLEKRLVENYYGRESKCITVMDHSISISEEVGGSTVLIIKGEIVTPSIVQVIQQVELP